MEISFSPTPETNANVGAQAGTACPRQEFSFLMAAFLKSAEPDALLEAGLSGADGVQVDGAAREAGDEVEETSAQVIEALAALFAPITVDSQTLEGEKDSLAGTGAISAALSAPAGEVNGDFSLDENMKALMKDGAMELPKGLEITAQGQEDFEIEIPAGEIMGENAEDKTAVPQVASSSQSAEELGSVFSEQQASADNENAGNEQAGYMSAVKAETLPVSPEFDLSGNLDDDAGENNPAEAMKATDNQVAGPVFGSTIEKTIDELSQRMDAQHSKPAVMAEVHEKVQAGISVSVESDGGEVRMKLNPDSLGEVRIKLNVDSGRVTAEILVDNPEVKSIIESDSSFLKDSLGQHGLTLDKCVVEVGRSFESSEQEADDRRQPYADERAPQGEERGSEKGRGAWQRHFKQNQARHDEGGIDFFA